MLSGKSSDDLEVKKILDFFCMVQLWARLLVVPLVDIQQDKGCLFIRWPGQRHKCQHAHVRNEFGQMHGCKEVNCYASLWQDIFPSEASLEHICHWLRLQKVLTALQEITEVHLKDIESEVKSDYTLLRTVGGPLLDFIGLWTKDRCHLLKFLF